MTQDPQTTRPKPFIFVLMPFEKRFDDIYKLGIKASAHEVGAYAERLDEQLFHEGMLDRIFNQVNKADVIVADMTGQNPNVFYEVGYAHALGKIVLLLTNNSGDIPFDLKQRLHIVYEDSIVKLKEELSPYLEWAIKESQRSILAEDMFQEGDYEVLLVGVALHPAPIGVTGPRLRLLGSPTLAFNNLSTDEAPPIEMVYLYYSEDNPLIPDPHKY